MVCVAFKIFLLNTIVSNKVMVPICSDKPVVNKAQLNNATRRSIINEARAIALYMPL